jgi:uncharacterized cupredoxin-like copper-binding protein
MLVLLLGAPLVHCSSADSESMCFPDNDGVSDKPQAIDLTVTDTGFSRAAITTQNDSVVTFTLTNTGKKPHGFEVETTSVKQGYPNLPAGCPTTASFPPDSIINALAPGKSKTITFITPTPDNITFPVKSTEAADSKIPGLNGSGSIGWTLM